MAGTGAMYGALDVGFLITRSESGARRMRVEVEARDFAAPDALGVVIDGTGSGEHGGFTYTDTATLVHRRRPPPRTATSSPSSSRSSRTGEVAHASRQVEARASARTRTTSARR